MERYKEVIVALPKSVMKIRLKRTLVEKSRWHHIRLAIKPRYLGNRASHRKSYHGTLIGSHSPSFRNRHEKSPEAPPSGEITMTSYPACNQTSLARKPCIPDKTLPWNTIRKSWSVFKIRHNICYWVKLKNYICCFMRVTHALNNIYKLISFLK